jgi:hypothetical protein
MTTAFLAGFAVCAWGAWRLALGQTRPPPLPSLGEYQTTITLPPSGAMQRRREHDGHGRK